MVRKSLILAVMMTMTAGLNAANADPIEDRQKILKGFGDTTKPVAAMLKGEAPFDLAPVQAALDGYIDGVKKLPSLFPDDSKTGHKTEALPRIWDEKPKFEALYEKLGKDAEAAKASITDEASLKAAYPKVLGDCKACHDDYREKK
jgi:cytochrome c556